MIKLFPGLRIAEIVCYCMVLTYTGWLYKDGMDPVLAGLAALAAMAVVAFGVRLRAVMMHQKLVNILYKWLEPARFIASYEPLLKKAAGKPALESTVRNYLSTGYAAGGDFETAIRLLEETPKVEGEQALRGEAFKLTNLSHVCVVMGDVARSEEYLRKFEALEAGDTEGQLGKSMNGTAAILRNYIKVMRGWKAEEGLLSRMANYTTTSYDLAMNRYFLALCQLNGKNKEDGVINLRNVANRAPKLYIGKDAARRLQAMGESLEGPETAAPVKNTERIVQREFLKPNKKKWGLF
ncbi:MAG: hypothetical protein IIV90_05365 [Oscillospiraceae bacterium]|nr:hypothetical protein [Oscillospiraceae bacterium]